VAEQRRRAVTDNRWHIGDEIDVPTSKGTPPAWSTQRVRYWKNEAAKQESVTKWGIANVERMRAGRAPQRYNPDRGRLESMELSHEPVPKREGGIQVVPRWPQEHAAVDAYRKPGY